MKKRLVLTIMVFAFSVAVMAAEKYAVSTKQLLLHHNKPSHSKAKAEQNPLIDAFISLSDTDCQPLKALGVKVNVRFGDMNNDGLVDVTDTSILINGVLDKSSANLRVDRADINGDGVIDVTDVSLLIGIALGM